jgi:hypothetical protein
MPAIIQEGFKRHVEKCVASHQNGSVQAHTVVPFEEYNTLYWAVCNKIGDAIRMKHGIKCFEDGDSSNENPVNIIYMHPCDVINVMLRKNLMLSKPRVVVQTSIFCRRRAVGISF